MWKTRGKKEKTMSELTAGKADYGNWVPTKFIFVPGALGLFFGVLAFLLPLLAVVAVIFFLCALYFAYARYSFSPRGGDIQAQVQDLVLDRMAGWDGTGQILDIGCGNGPLTIQIAQRYPQAQVRGIDYWGTAWEYSQGVCERNAAIAGVAERTTFERASAASLPFDDEAFDVVVSNLVFHEVRDVRDKSKLVKQALRVLKKGGRFVFQDLFLWKQVYGNVDELLDEIRSWGIETVELVDTSASDFVPKALKLPFMLGTMGILYGTK
jgi:SAM-dependent methyltransferase